MAVQRTGFARNNPLSHRAARSLLWSGAALVLAGTAMAQDGVESQPIVLETVTLTGGAIRAADNSIVEGHTATGSKTPTELVEVPAQVSVVTEDDLRTRDPRTLMQALSYTSSVSVDEYGSDNRYDFYRIRGFSASGTYRDGLPLRTFNFTGGRIEPYSVQRIEVLKGSTSSLFGLNGPGGLVNVITKRPQSDPFGEVFVTAGDGIAETGVDFGAPIDADGTWTYRLTAKLQDSEDGSPALNDDRAYLAGALTWKPGDATALTLLANYYDIDGNAGNSIPVGSAASRDTYFGEPDFNALDRIERSFGYEFSHDFGNGLTFRQNARYSSFDMNLKQAYVSGLSGDDVLRSAYEVDGELKRFAIDNQLQYDRDFGNVGSRSLLGVEYVKDDLDEAVDYFTVPSVDIDDPVPCGLRCLAPAGGTIYDMTQKSTGIYLQEELTSGDRWILTLGGRYDTVRTDTGAAAGTNEQDAFTKRLGLTHKINPDLAVYANYSESFEPVSSGYVPALTDAPEPQEGRQYELGMKYRPAGGDALLSAALFDLSQTNVPRVNDDFTYSQVGRIDVRGLEIEGRMPVGDQANLLFSYSYWDSEIVGGPNAGNSPELTPKHLASVWADYTFADNSPAAGLRLGGGARFLGSRWSDDGNTVKIGSAVVFDAMASYPLTDKTELAVNVSNLFDRKYISEYNFTNTSIFYGDGRSVQATLRHRW